MRLRSGPKPTLLRVVLLPLRREPRGNVRDKCTYLPFNIKMWPPIGLQMYHLKSLSYTNVGFVKLMLVSNQLIKCDLQSACYFKVFKVKRMRGTPICDSFLLVGRDKSNVVVNFDYGITSSSSWSFLFVILKHASLELQGPVKTCALFQRWPPWACTYKHAHTYHTYLCASSAHSSHFMRNWGKIISWPRGSFPPQPYWIYTRVQAQRTTKWSEHIG